MEILKTIVEKAKIPLKILLPALWLFSGLLTLFSDEILTKLFLLEWRNKNGFVLGIIFLITSCLIIIYAILFIKSRILYIISSLTRNKRTIKRLFKLDYTRLEIIISLYHSAGYTNYLNYSEPLVQTLLAENYIYAGMQQLISVDMITNEMPTKFTLQPFVYQALDDFKLQCEKRKTKLTQKLGNEKNSMKKIKLQEEIATIQDVYIALYNKR